MKNWCKVLLDMILLIFKIEVYFTNILKHQEHSQQTKSVSSYALIPEDMPR